MKRHKLHVSEHGEDPEARRLAMVIATIVKTDRK